MMRLTPLLLALAAAPAAAQAVTFPDERPAPGAAPRAEAPRAQRPGEAGGTTGRVSLDALWASAVAYQRNEARPQLIERLRAEGYTEIVLDQPIVWETRYTRIYLGTPRVPGWATQVVVALITDDRFTTRVAIATLDPRWHHSVAFDTRAASSGQLFGLGEHRGFQRVPLYVVAMAR